MDYSNLFRDFGLISKREIENKNLNLNDIYEARFYSGFKDIKKYRHYSKSQKRKDVSSKLKEQDVTLRNNFTPPKEY